MRSRAPIVGLWFACALAFAALAACAAPPSDPAPLAGGRESAPVALACGDGDRDAQRHGTACLCCHANEFGVAGSVDREGDVARIEIDDARGQRVLLEPNALANFFGHERLVAPLRARMVDSQGRVSAMSADAPSGDCNRCHAVGGSSAPLGAGHKTPAR